MKNVTDFRKTMKTGVDPRLLRFYRFEPKSIVLGYFNTVPDNEYEHLSNIWLFTLKIGAAQLRSVTEIAPKLLFLRVNRSHTQYGFRAGAKASI